MAPATLEAEAFSLGRAAALRRCRDGVEIPSMGSLYYIFDQKLRARGIDPDSRPDLDELHQRFLTSFHEGVTHEDRRGHTCKPRLATFGQVASFDRSADLGEFTPRTFDVPAPAAKTRPAPPPRMSAAPRTSRPSGVRAKPKPKATKRAMRVPAAKRRLRPAKARRAGRRGR